MMTTELLTIQLQTYYFPECMENKEERHHVRSFNEVFYERRKRQGRDHRRGDQG